MGSINAQRVAVKVSETIQRGEIVKLGEIIEKVGYSKQTALKPSLVTNTKSYKTTLELEKRPIIDGIQKEINRIKDAIAAKDLSNEEVRVLIYALDTLVKNYQLLSGGATERQVFVLPSEVLGRNKIETSKDDVKKLENGSS